VGGDDTRKEVTGVIEVFSSGSTAVIVSGAATALALGITALLVGLIVVVAGSGGEGAVRDVQRDLALTQEAHSIIPHGSMLADPNGETSAAIVPFLAKKEEAHRALWASASEALRPPT
jgi:hypothetical protein